MDAESEPAHLLAEPSSVGSSVTPPAPAGAPGPEDMLADEAARRPSKWRVVWRIVVLLVALLTLYGLLPSVLAVFSEAPRLRDGNPLWFIAMLGAECLSFVSVWWLTRIAIPGAGWFKVSTSQLTSNAVSRVVPGGGAVGTAVFWRMLSAAGIDKGQAGAAIAATSLIQNGVLFAIPLVAVIGSIFGSPVPPSLSVVAWGGALLFAVLFAFGFVLVRFDRPLHFVGRLVERISTSLSARLHRESTITDVGLVRQRDTIVAALGPRWEQALAAAVGKWLFDYLALVAALYAIGAEPRLSLVLLAYGVAAALASIPITPGGLGFVEAGLTATLVVAGVSADDALLATLAYRIVSYWLPLPVGLGARFLFWHRYRPRLEAAAAG